MRIHPAIGAALLAAALFGLGVPLAKLLLASASPLLLAGLLYLGAGLGLAAVWYWRRARAQTAEAALARGDAPWLFGAVVLGGALAPALLMIGLNRTSAATASLLLNLEGVFTALLAWFAFREHVDRRVAAGFAAIAAGGVLLSFTGEALHTSWGAVAIAGACLAWGLDNNLTRKIAGADPIAIAAIKGLVAGGVNLALAFSFGAAWPGVRAAGLAAVLGFFAYGVSLALFVWALRALGTARTSAYFGTAPFVGAAASVAIFGYAADPMFWIAAVLMAIGVWLHLAERHDHLHTHTALSHAHRHVHDAHHRHTHDFAWDGREPHTHPHRHEPLTHAHAHYPDLHHRHRHRRHSSD